jgi:hypothetical protein
MWPIIGLKSAVMVVGGSTTLDAEVAVAEEEGGLEEELELEDDDGDCDGCVANSSSGVVSGKVVNRIPVDTAERT